LIAIARARRIPINWDATSDQLAAYLGDRLAKPGILDDLATLDRHDVRPCAGPIAWLPPSALAFWGARCATLPGNPNARSEARTHRRRWLHFLAAGARLPIQQCEAVGLVGPVGPLLKPTLAGHVWLDQPPETPWQALVAALTPPDAVCWRAQGERVFRVDRILAMRWAPDMQAW